jgi:transposase
MIDALDRQLAPLDKALRAYARRQPGCKVLMGQCGVGELTAVTILAELGDARRFSSSRHAILIVPSGSSIGTNGLLLPFRTRRSVSRSVARQRSYAAAPFAGPRRAHRIRASARAPLQAWSATAAP